jgi:hypothetical protein
MMKPFLITILSFFAYSSAFAQDCKWQEKKNDPFSDTKYLKSKQLSKWVVARESGVVGPMTYFKSYIELKDGKVLISLLFETLPMLSLEKISKPTLSIRLLDGSKIVLNTEEQFSINIQASVNRTSSTLIWAIEKEDLKKLAGSAISAMRISFSGKDYSYELKEKHSEEFLRMFECMNQEL